MLHCCYVDVIFQRRVHMYRDFLDFKELRAHALIVLPCARTHRAPVQQPAVRVMNNEAVLLFAALSTREIRGKIRD